MSGAFYPKSQRELQRMIESFVIPVAAVEKAIGLIAPHAGYIYSGRTAGAVYSQVEIPQVALILAPNHTGRGRTFGGAGIVSRGTFMTPMGEVEIEETIAEGCKSKCELIGEDREAHEYEHSLEVQLPFLQVLRQDIKIVPLVTSYDEFDIARTIGEALAGVIKESGEEVLIIASSDMTHYQPRNVARKLDGIAIKRVEDLDPEGLLNVTREEGITMCGKAPVATMLVAAKMLGATVANLVDYSDSADVSGDTSYVVGYAGILIK